MRSAAVLESKDALPHAERHTPSLPDARPGSDRFRCAVRELEVRIQKAERLGLPKDPGVDTPAGIPIEYGEYKCGIPAPEPEGDARRSDLRRGWYWGSQAFAERMLKMGEAVLKKPRHRSARASQEKRAHGEQEARRLLAEGLAVAGLSEAALKKLPGSDARKVAVARVVWEQTTVDMTWLAGHLHLRSAANASQQIRRHRQHPQKMSKPLQRWMLQSENVA